LYWEWVGSPFPFFLPCARIGTCRLRHSASAERDGLPTGSFPTERSGSRQEVRAWVKRSRLVAPVQMHHMNIISHIYDRFLIALPLSSHAKILYTSEKVREGGQEPHASRQGRAFRLAQRKFLTSGLVPRFSPHKQQRSWLIFPPRRSGCELKGTCSPSCYAGFA